MPVAFLVFALLLSATMIIWPAAWRELYVASGTFASMRKFWQERSNMFYRVLGVLSILVCLAMFDTARHTPAPVKSKTAASTAIK